MTLNPILVSQSCPKCGALIDLNTHNDDVTKLPGGSTSIHSFGRVCSECKTQLDITITAHIVIHGKQND